MSSHDKATLTTELVPHKVSIHSTAPQQLLVCSLLHHLPAQHNGNVVCEEKKCV